MLFVFAGMILKKNIAVIDISELQTADIGGLASGLIWKELAVSLAHRNKLVDRMSQLENQVNTLEGTETTGSSPSPVVDAAASQIEALPQSSEASLTRTPLSAISVPTAPTTSRNPSASSTKSSPRRRGDPSTNRRKSPKDKKVVQSQSSQNVKNSQQSMITIDSKLNSIIANALDSDNSNQPLVNISQENSKEAVNGPLFNSWFTSSGSNPPKAATKSPYLRTTPTTLSNVVEANKDFPSKKLCTSNISMENNKLIQEHSSYGKLSVPVKLPLSEVGKKLASVPVSIPLQKIHGESSLKHVVETCTSRVLPAMTVQTCVPGSDHLGHIYSPISRPSSSSSTASAESVRNLENGARITSISPRPSSGTPSFHIDSLFGIDRPPVSAATAATAHYGTGQFTHKDLAYAHYAALHAEAARGLPSALSSYPHSLPDIDGPFLSQQRDLYTNMLMSSGMPYATATSQSNNTCGMGDINGLIKMPPLSPAEDKKKVQRRKRSCTKTSLSAPPVKQSRSSSHSLSLPEETGAHRRIEFPMANKMKQDQSPTMPDIMSNVSKPLAISALPDEVVSPRFYSGERDVSRQAFYQENAPTSGSSGMAHSMWPPVCI